MKILVGQREKVDPDKKTSLALVETFVSPDGPKATKIEFSEVFQW